MFNEIEAQGQEGSKSGSKETSQSPFLDYVIGPAARGVKTALKNITPEAAAEALVYPLAAEGAIKNLGGPDITSTRREHRKENPKTAFIEGMASPHLVTADAMFRKYILGGGK